MQSRGRVRRARASALKAGEIAEIQDEWIITDSLDIQVQKPDGTVRKGGAYDIHPGDFVEAEVKLDIQLIKGRNGEKQARIKMAMTHVVRLSQAKQLPVKTVAAEAHGLTTISARRVANPAA